MDAKPAPPVRAAEPVPPRPPEALVSGAKSFSLSHGPGNPWPLFGAAFRNILAARKTILLALLLLLPLLITAIVAGAPGGLKKFGREDRDKGLVPEDQSGGLLWFDGLSFQFVYPFLIPLVVAVFAAGIVREEVEGKTLPYLFTRPIYRNWLVIPKYLAVCLSVSILVAGSLVAFWFTSVSVTENPFKHFGQLVGFVWVAVLTVFVTAALFTLVGTLLKRGAILIGLYLFVWESGLSNLQATFVQRASIVHYEKAILTEIAGHKRSFQEEAFIGSTDPVMAHVVLIGLAVLGLIGALYVVSNKDYNV